MKVYKSQSEVEKDIKDNVLVVDEDVKFECSISIEASLKIAGNINAEDINARDINAGDINAEDINALDIDAGDINAEDINAEDINAGDINAGNINALDINAWNINARNINAEDINAWNINAGDILYYAFCCVYNSIKCLSIKAKREVHQEPICLDGELTIKDKSKNPTEIMFNNARYKLIE